jgi:acyl dehydratase
MAQSGLLRGGMALLGITNMRLPNPLYCGDTLKVEIRVLSKRETSKPDRGVVTFSHRGVISQGDVVIEYEAVRMISRGSET